MNFLRNPTLSPRLPPYAQAVALHNMANTLESSYDFAHDSDILDNMIIFKYLSIEAMKSDSSISCDES